VRGPDRVFSTLWDQKTWVVEIADAFPQGYLGVLDIALRAEYSAAQ